MPLQISKVLLKSGSTIDVSSGLTLVVGPNNVGKTLLLNEVVGELNLHESRNYGDSNVVVEGVEVLRTGSEDEFLESFRAAYERRPPGSYSDGNHAGYTYRLPNGGHAVDEKGIRAIWNGRSGRLGYLAPFLLRHLSAEGRLGAVQPAPGLNLLVEQPSHPLQVLYSNRELEDQFSLLMKRAFDVELTLNRYAGNTITAHVGKTTIAETRPPQSRDYLAELAALPMLHAQGDGIRAFMGILLTILTGSFPIVVIDEPEAFLHPPQAYLLGRILAERHNGGAQLIVATHSTDIVRGVTSIQAAAGNVTIVRLTRNMSGNQVAQVPSSAVRELYEDPLVKYYGVLDGLFFQGVVLCEADSDCTYYQAVLDTLEKLGNGTPVSSVSLHFAHTGGKARLPRAVRALRSAGVPVVSVVDFDFLRDDSDFAALVSAHGEMPEALSAWRNDVVSAIASRSEKVNRDSAKAMIDAVFSERKGDLLTSGDVRKIQDAITAKGGWRDAKKFGRGSLSGQAVTSFDKLNAALRGVGVFVVEVGELERFHPEVPADNKAEWLRVVLEERKFANSSTSADMMRQACTYVFGRQ